MRKLINNRISPKMAEGFLVTIIFLVGFLARFMYLGAVPNGLNQDEAYAGYEAYSLLHYGVDSWGYSFPVYLTTWGSGMSIMNAYLMIPFIALFGSTAYAIRLPQAILGMIALVYFYKLFRLFFKDDSIIPVIALFILAVNPWHILMCRWALDCNMAPVFCLIAFYYFCRGVDEPEFYMLSALFYGLTLYCYALTWILVPVFIIWQGIFLILTKKFKVSVYLICSVVIIAFLALPLILFVFVNSGAVKELNFGIISIPKMPMFRASEIDFGNKRVRLIGFITSIIHQNDGLIWNYAGKYGLYYTWGLVLSILGFVDLILRGIMSLFKRSYKPEVMILIPIGVCLIFSALLDANFSKMNFFHLPMIAMSVIGVRRLMGIISNIKIRKALALVLCIIGLIPFIMFERYYFVDYKAETASNFKSGLKECVEYADEIADNDIFIFDYAAHPCILFYEQIPATDEKLIDSRNAGITVATFSHYSFIPDDASEGDICIFKNGFPPAWYSDDMKLFSEGIYIVAEKKA